MRQQSCNANGSKHPATGSSNSHSRSNCIEYSGRTIGNGTDCESYSYGIAHADSSTISHHCSYGSQRDARTIHNTPGHKFDDYGYGYSTILPNIPNPNTADAGDRHRDYNDKCDWDWVEEDCRWAGATDLPDICQ